VLHRLRIDEGGGLWWQRPGSGWLRADVAPAQAAELAKTLADAVP
jgi:hypothetical protein